MPCTRTLSQLSHLHFRGEDPDPYDDPDWLIWVVLLVPAVVWVGLPLVWGCYEKRFNVRIGFCRFLSAYCWVLFWLTLPYEIWCVVTQCWTWSVVSWPEVLFVKFLIC